MDTGVVWCWASSLLASQLSVVLSRSRSSFTLPVECNAPDYSTGIEDQGRGARVGPSFDIFVPSAICKVSQAGVQQTGRRDQSSPRRKAHGRIATSL